MSTFKAENIAYSETGYFSKIITDYLSQNPLLQPFYSHPSSLNGVKEAIEKRRGTYTNRQLLVDQLLEQYASVETSEEVKENIKALLDENTFTVCTAHQPNIFTGHLYFIYKIVHTIRLANTLNRELTDNRFVPVFYMGSEDADLEELGEVSINGEKYKWETGQTGAVGRMIVDDGLLKILKKIKGELAIEPFGKEVIAMVQECYTKGRTIQDACFCLVNKLFSEYGLLVLMPDNAAYKKVMQAIFEDDIFSNTPSRIVAETSGALAKQYKVQAHPREINLFYLADNIRNRIVEHNGMYRVNDTGIQFSKETLRKELSEHPERFSPNVILRALYQETILPNVIFVGGGGELAYWLELKDMFAHYGVPYPVLALRNSFLLVDEKAGSLVQKLSLIPADIFMAGEDLIKNIVRRNTKHQLSLEKEKEQVKALYSRIKNTANTVDSTLVKHVDALQARLLKTLDNLEKKLLKAEKRRFEAQQNQVKKMRALLFPGNILQERVDNFMPYYARWGKEFIKVVYDHSLNFEQAFCIINEQK